MVGRTGSGLGMAGSNLMVKVSQRKSDETSAPQGGRRLIELANSNIASATAGS